MHDIWNPWHGCVRESEGCKHCYMFFLDRMRGGDGSRIYRTQGFDYPLQKDAHGNYKVKSGEMLRVCMTSDFFLKEADEWRDEAWKIMARRPDVKFFLLTKRPYRVASCLPSDWKQGYENVFFNVSCENQRRADERIPLLLELPFRHKGVMCAPFIGPVSLEKYLCSNQIEQVICDGENYDGSRVCSYEWVKRLSYECRRHNVTFVFAGTGRRFEKDGRVYRIEGKATQIEQAYRSNLSFKGRELKFVLTDSLGIPIPEYHLYQPHYSQNCDKCAMRLACNGCSECGNCEKKSL